MHTGSAEGKPNPAALSWSCTRSKPLAVQAEVLFAAACQADPLVCLQVVTRVAARHKACCFMPACVFAGMIWKSERKKKALLLC